MSRATRAAGEREAMIQTTQPNGPLRLVLSQEWHPYAERLECGHIWRPIWRNATGSYRMGIMFAARRRCVECAALAAADAGS